MLKVYNLLVHIAYRIISIIGLSSDKYQRFYQSKKKRLNIPLKETSRILIHCASLGEYEMAKGTALALKKKGLEVIISFFSPSGFEHTPDHSACFDYKVYLPMDTTNKVKAFLKDTNPDFILFIKSEVWPNLLDQVVLKNIPFAFLGMDFSGHQDKYFSFPMNLISSSLLKAKHFYVQTIQTKDTLLKNGAREDQVSVCRNPRIDTILEARSENPIHFPIKSESKIFVFGSVYLEDIPMIRSCISNYPSFIYYVFPHHLDDLTTKKFKEAFSEVAIFDGKFKTENTLVFEMGYLKHIYNYANICYVGGGFQAGIHNILEPILNDCVCIIGPKHKAFQEAKSFIETVYLHEISNPEDIIETIQQVLMQSNDISQVDQFLNKHKNCQDKLILLILQSIRS